MAIEVERLVATLEANFNKYDKALNKALGNTDRTFRRIETRGKQLESRLSALGGNVGRSLAAGFGGLIGAAGLRGAQQLIDSATRIQNALKVAGLSGEDLSRVYDRLFASAQKNAVPIETMVTLYSRLAQSQDALNISQQEMTNFTDKIGVALRVAGASAQEASGALLQLSQALGGGIVRAEEFNSINEGARPILQAVAAGLKEAGGSVGTLRQLVVDGKVSSEAFFRAFEAGSVVLEDKLAGATLTIGQALTQLNNTLVDAAGKFNETSGAGRSAAEALVELSAAVTGLSNVFEAAAEGPLGTFIGKLSQLNDLIQKTLPAFNALGLLDGNVLNDIASAITPTVEVDRAGLRQQLEGLYADLEKAGATGQGLLRQQIADLERELYGGGPASRGGRRGTSDSVAPVSLADYKIPASQKTKKTRESDYAREVRQIQERTAALQAETSVMAGLNPLINDYGFAIEKAAAKQELLSAAKKQGLKVTPELSAQMDALAASYAQASVNAEVLAESQDKVRDRMEEMNDLGRDVLGGFIDDLVAGESAADAFASALGKIGDKLLDIALNSINFGSLFGGSGSSFGTKTGFADMLGLVFHKGGKVGSGGTRRAVHPGVFAGAPRMHGGGLAGDEVPAILQKGEVVLPKGSSQASRGGVSVDARTTIDARGADQAAIARLEQAMARRDAELPAKIVETVRKANKQNVKFA